MASAEPLDIVIPSDQRKTTITAPALSEPEVTVPPTAGTLPAFPVPLLATTVSRPYTELPNRLNGKVFFSNGTADYVSSGTIVNSSN